MKKMWTPVMEDVLRRDYPDNGARWCAERLGVRWEQARKRANVLGLRVSDFRMRQKQSENSKRFWVEHPERLSGVDYRVFVNCRTKEAAYILGLLWSDGYLQIGRQHIIAVELVADDLDNLKDVFGATGSWYISRRHRKNRRPQACARISNKLLCLYLVSCGYDEKNRKSACGILDKIPENLRRYWWRGFFDGDGCIYLNEKEYCYQVSLAGGLEQDWAFVENLLTSLNIRYEIQRRTQIVGKKKSTSSCVRITKKDGVSRFCEYIYGERYDGIGLVRKYKRYEDFTSFVENTARLGYDLRARREWVRQMMNDRMTCKDMARCLGVSEDVVYRDIRLKKKFDLGATRYESQNDIDTE